MWVKNEAIAWANDKMKKQTSEKMDETNNEKLMITWR